MKTHTLLDLRGNIPSFVALTDTDGKVNESGMHIKTISILRTAAKIGLSNLAYNMM